MIWSRSGATLPAEFVTSTRSDITPAIPLMTAGFETYGLQRSETDCHVCGLPPGTATLPRRTNQVRGDWENEFAFLSPARCATNHACGWFHHVGIRRRYPGLCCGLSEIPGLAVRDQDRDDRP